MAALLTRNERAAEQEDRKPAAAATGVEGGIELMSEEKRSPEQERLGFVIAVAAAAEASILLSLELGTKEYCPLP